MADLISQLLQKSLSWVRPGITTFELDAMIEAEMDRMGVIGSCKGYEGFPAVSCLSVNDQITHGVPDGTLLKEGDSNPWKNGLLRDGALKSEAL